MILQAFSLGALTATQLALSLLLQLVVIAQVGVGTQTDAWVAAQAVPIVLLAIAAVAFQGSWQSELVIANSDEPVFRAKLGSAQGQLLIALGSMVFLLVLSAPWWTRWLFPAFGAEQHALTSQMTMLLLAGTLLNGHAALFTTALRARQTFVMPEVVQAVGNALAIVIALVLIPRMGVVAAAWGSLLRSVFVCGTLFLVSCRTLPAPIAGWRDIEAWRRIRPLLLGTSIYKSSPIVDRFFGSLAPAGGLTTLNLAMMGMTSLAGVLERALCTVPTTRLGKLAQARDFAGIRGTYRRCLKLAALATVAVLATFLALLPFWQSLAHAALGLTPVAAMDLWWYCVLLVGILIPASCGTAFTFSFYALADTGTPAKIGTVGFLVSIALKAAAFHFFGIYGIVISIVMHYVGNVTALWWLLERRLRREALVPETQVP